MEPERVCLTHQLVEEKLKTLHATTVRIDSSHKTMWEQLNSKASTKFAMWAIGMLVASTLTFMGYVNVQVNTLQQSVYKIESKQGIVLEKIQGIEKTIDWLPRQ